MYKVYKYKWDWSDSMANNMRQSWIKYAIFKYDVNVYNINGNDSLMVGKMLVIDNIKYTDYWTLDRTIETEAELIIMFPDIMM